MIFRFNIAQITAAVFCILGSAMGYLAAYLFFRHVPAFIARSFGIPLSSLAFAGFAAVVLCVLTYSGYRLWKTRGGFYGYHESALYHDLGENSGGGSAMDFYAHRVTGPAYMLGQLFAAGPLLALRAWFYFRSIIPVESGLEERLRDVLARLRSLNKWQGFRDHPDDVKEILLLARMKKIDFSAAKGEPRFRAFSGYGTES